MLMRRIVVNVWVLLGVCSHHCAANKKCERLKTSLTYSQEKAPRDLSGVLPVVVERVNQELEGVVDVAVKWTGSDLHGRVGDHIVRCEVSRLASAVSPAEKSATTDDGIIKQCFELAFSIRDTNECQLPSGHPMRHQCKAGSICVNTVGAYECLCPLLESDRNDRVIGNAGEAFWQRIAGQERTAWELSFSLLSKSTCPSMPTTKGCCSDLAHSSEGRACRAGFSCPIDPCGPGDNACADTASCERLENPMSQPNHRCVCPPGLLGNGRKCRPGIDPMPRPRVKYDGVTPTDETRNNDFYCNCTKPEMDPCEGFPPCTGNHEICTVTTGNRPICTCKPGWIHVDRYGCVDETPPVLKLRHDPHSDKSLRLQQGDMYKEYAVDILDENAEEYLRSLHISYSTPLPPGCLTKMDDFHVNYTIETPWTTPPYVRITRRVIVDDIDECSLDVAKYKEKCPQLIPQCDISVGAKCVNTLGSYTCQCPKFTSGDGFLKEASFPTIDAPKEYLGGTSCVDNHQPTIELLGPQPKKFKVCKCGGLGRLTMNGAELSGLENGMEELCTRQREKYDAQLREIILSTSGAELCATGGNPNPRPSSCVRALDETHIGTVNLTSQVRVGGPVQKTEFTWSVPYTVSDSAGNEAKTVWRDVVVEEVDLFDLERKVHAGVFAEKEQEIAQAVAKALEEERKKREDVEVIPVKTKTRTARQVTTSSEQQCPACPKCECNNQVPTTNFDKERCDLYCDRKIAEARASCAAHSRFYEFFETTIPTTLFWMGFCIFAFLAFVIVLRLLSTLAFNPGALTGRRQNDYNSPPPPAPPGYHRAVDDTPLYNRRGPDAGGGLFSPQESRGYVQSPTSPFLGAAPQTPTHRRADDSIYVDGGIITPNRDGLLRRTNGR